VISSPASEQKNKTDTNPSHFDRVSSKPIGLSALSNSETERESLNFDFSSMGYVQEARENHVKKKVEEGNIAFSHCVKP
jgi:hypothetical protein